MSIDIYEHQDSILSTDLGRYLKDSYGRNQLKRLTNRWLDRISLVFSKEPIPNLNMFVDKYAEQIVNDARSDISKYLSFLSRRGFTIGGVSTGVVPLAILPKDVKPNTTAISTIGEALAGWYLETKRSMNPLARPVGEGPDLIFMDSTRTYYSLVEVKATQEQGLRERLKEATLKLLDYTGKIKLMSPHTVFSIYVIGVVIRTDSDYEMISIRINLR